MKYPQTIIYILRLLYIALVATIASCDVVQHPDKPSAIKLFSNNKIVLQTYVNTAIVVDILAHNNVMTAVDVSVENPANGLVSTNPLNHNFIYTPSKDFVGKDSMQYKICGDTDCKTGMILIEIKDTTPICTPKANDDMLIMKSDSVVYNVLNNDRLCNMVPVTKLLQSSPAAQFTLSKNGKLSVKRKPVIGSGQYIYANYEMCTDNSCDTAKISIWLEATPTDCRFNLMPMPDELRADVNQEKYISLGILLLNDVSCPNDINPKSFTIEKLPLNGRIIRDTSSGRLEMKYVPKTNFRGKDVFTYKVCLDSNPQFCKETEVNIFVP